jgi:hypothetical protein
MRPEPATHSRPTVRVFERDENGDRPSALPARRGDGVVYEYHEDTWGDVWFELGLRVFETGFAALALAVGEEVFYYFRQRRFHRHHEHRR